MPESEKRNSALLFTLAALPLVFGISWSISGAGASQTPMQHCARSVSELNERLLADGLDVHGSAFRQRKRTAYYACLEDPVAFDKLLRQN
jgi:hypothetical protein